MNDLYIALENCLDDLHRGKSMEDVLASYPRFARELHPLLQAAQMAGMVGRLAVPEEARRRSRLRILQRASEIRGAGRAPHRRLSLAWGFPRMAVAIGLVFVLALSSTGLVSASSSALPGDQLYPFKRSWENMQLFFIINPEGRDLLESHYEQERLDEIDDLLLARRSAPIVFSGLVMQMQDGQIMVSGIPVVLGASMTRPSSGIHYGVPVTVVGVTRANGVVDAQEIQLLQPGAQLPPFEPSDAGNQAGTGGSSGGTLVLPGGVSTSVPSASATKVPGSTIQQTGSTFKPFQFSGVVESMKGNAWNINGQVVTMDEAVITGSANIGSVVSFVGYYSAEGKFVVTTLQVKTIPAHSDRGGKGGGGQGDGEGEGGGDP